MSDTRQHAHELIDRMPDTQLSALVGLLETIIESATEDEEIGEEEAQVFPARPGPTFALFLNRLR